VSKGFLFLEFVGAFVIAAVSRFVALPFLCFLILILFFCLI